MPKTELQAPSAGARLDRLPICSFHSRVLALIASGLFLDSVDMYIQGPLLAYFLSIGWSSLAMNANFLSMTFTGLLVGTLVSGRLSDRFGRRRMYQLNLLLFGGATLLAAFAPSPQLLVACRFFIGIGLGGEVVVSYGTLAEFVPPGVRGIWQGKLAALSNLGLPCSALLCSTLLPTFGWRPALGLLGILAGAVWLFRRSMPESPRWYEAVGRFDEAELTLRAIEAEVERSTGRPLPPNVVFHHLPKPCHRTSLRTLFQGNLLRRTLLAASLMVCANIAVYTFTAWLPTVLLRRTLTMKSTLLVTLILQLGCLPGALVGSWAGERFGRRYSIGFLSFGAALTGIAFGLASTVLQIVSTGFLLFLLVYALVALTFAVYVPEIFPTALRMTGSSFANACGRTANIFVPQVIPWMLVRHGPSSVCFAIAGLLGIQTAIIWAFGEDTEMRSLEAISNLDS